MDDGREVAIVELSPASASFIRQQWIERWSGDRIHSGTRIYGAGDVRGFTIAGEGGRPAALVTVAGDGDSAEVVSLDALIPGAGHGRQALAAVEAMLRDEGFKTVRIVTTNDNLHAAMLYLKRGYRLAKVNLDAMDEVRRVKPAVPLTGADGIPLRDEWELEKTL